MIGANPVRLSFLIPNDQCLPTGVEQGIPCDFDASFTVLPPNIHTAGSLEVFLSNIGIHTKLFKSTDTSVSHIYGGAGQKHDNIHTYTTDIQCYYVVHCPGPTRNRTEGTRNWQHLVSP